MSTFTIRGQQLRSQSNRRFIVVACRPADFEGRRWDGGARRADGGSGDYVPATYRAFKPEILKRSDSLETAKTAARRYGFVPGGWNVVIDTMTGEEIA